MTVYQEMEQLLREQPAARERKNKAHATRHFLIKRYPALADIPARTLDDAITDAGTYDRAWRRVTEEHEELRGKDYDQKVKHVLRKQEELGYHITTNP